MRLVKENGPSLVISTSFSDTFTTAGFAFAPRPNVIYPVSPVNAFIAVPDPVMGSGVTMSTAVIVRIENIAYSVGEYAKHAVS